MKLQFRSLRFHKRSAVATKDLSALLLIKKKYVLHIYLIWFLSRNQIKSKSGFDNFASKSNPGKIPLCLGFDMNLMAQISNTVCFHFLMLCLIVRWQPWWTSHSYYKHESDGSTGWHCIYISLHLK